jgi:hypothetical protein
VSLAVAKGVSIVPVQTIHARPHNPRRSARQNRKPVHVVPWSRPAAPVAAAAAAAAAQVESINPARLEEVEERLLAEAIEHHARVESALDGALDDMAVLSAEVHRSRRRPLLLRSATNLNRVEDLLLEAIVRAHPNREDALDRLLADVGDDDDTMAAAEHRERAAFDMTVDNDFDGMG